MDEQMTNMTETPKPQSLRTLLARKRCRLTVGRAGIDLEPSAGHSYFIEWDRTDTPIKLLNWVMHLAEKPWATPELLRDFLAAACDRHGINPHVNA